MKKKKVSLVLLLEERIVSLKNSAASAQCTDKRTTMKREFILETLRLNVALLRFISDTSDMVTPL